MPHAAACGKSGLVRFRTGMTTIGLYDTKQHIIFHDARRAAMGAPFARPHLVRDIDCAFHRDRIATTARRRCVEHRPCHRPFPSAIVQERAKYHADPPLSELNATVLAATCTASISRNRPLRFTIDREHAGMILDSSWDDRNSLSLTHID
jgi:hypothetical protein